MNIIEKIEKYLGTSFEPQTEDEIEFMLEELAEEVGLDEDELFDAYEAELLLNEAEKGEMTAKGVAGAVAGSAAAAVGASMAGFAISGFAVPAIVATIMYAAYKMLKKKAEIKKKKCNKKFTGDEQKKCLFNARTEEYKGKLKILTKSAKKCKDDKCKKSAEKAIAKTQKALNDLSY